MKIIKKKNPKANKLTLAKPKKNTATYYHCLADKASRGCLKGSVGKMCKECKEQSPQIALNRKQEIKKIVSSYKQLGVSLSKLLNK